MGSKGPTTIVPPQALPSIFTHFLTHMPVVMLNDAIACDLTQTSLFLPAYG